MPKLSREAEAIARKGFFKVHWSYVKKGLARKVGPSAHLLLTALATYMNRKRECYPSNATLSTVTGLSVSTIVRSKKRLKSLGLIRYELVREKGHTFDRYKLALIADRKTLPNVNAQGSEDIGTDIRLLHDYLDAYPKDSTYLQNNADQLKELKFPPVVLKMIQQTRASMDRARLYFAMATINTLHVCCDKIDQPFYAQVRGQIKSLIKFANIMFEAAEREDVDYEVAIQSFLTWVGRRRRTKTLNWGILPLLAGDWVQSVKPPPEE